MDRNEGGREGGRSGISEGNDGVEEKGNAKNEGGGVGASERMGKKRLRERVWLRPTESNFLT